MAAKKRKGTLANKIAAGPVEFQAGAKFPHVVSDLRKGKRTFAPYQPAQPPSGSYDPALDAQQHAADRGLLDLRLDTERDFGTGGHPGGRSLHDYLLGVANLNRQRGEGQQDMALAGMRAAQDFNTQRSDAAAGYARSTADTRQSLDRGVADLLTQRSRAGEDYGKNTQLLGRRYGILGASQTQRAQQQGSAEGGFFAAAKAARAENQGIEQGALDTGFRRFGESSALSEQRLRDSSAQSLQRQGEDQWKRVAGIGQAQQRYTADAGTRWKRLTEGTDRALADSGLKYQRAGENAAQTLRRAERENKFFGQDIAANRFYQSRTSGFIPATRPDNEKGTGAGTYREVKGKGGAIYRILADGTKIKVRGAARTGNTVKTRPLARSGL